MEKAEQILEKHINGDDLHFIFHEKKQLWRELLNAVNEALDLAPVSESVCDCISVIGSYPKNGIYYCKTCKKRKRKQPVR